MYTSVFLAKWLGPYCLIVAMGFLLNQQFYLKMIQDFVRNSALMYLGGVFALLLGLLLVLVNNVWTRDGGILVTALGWLTLLKGVWIIVFPGSVVKVTEYHFKNPSMFVIRLIILLLLGVIITYYGYSHNP